MLSSFVYDCLSFNVTLCYVSLIMCLMLFFVFLGIFAHRRTLSIGLEQIDERYSAIC